MSAVAWPLLREELVLYPGPSGAGGVPTWTLHDPVSNRFFRVARKTFEILSHWDEGDGEAVAGRVREETGLDVSPEDVGAVASFIRTHTLVQAPSPDDTRFLKNMAGRGRQGWANWLLKNYLFIRIPLIRPDRFLARTYPWIVWLYEPWVRWLLIVVGGIGIYLASRQWDTFITTFTDLFTIESVFWFAVALTLAKIIHELGHAYTAHRYGCRVAGMGIAFLVLWPVLYTDVTDAWKLPSRRARLAIGASGMAAELAIAIIATFLWSFLPDGPVRSAVFLVGTTTWIATLAVNAMPFLRFDGYYLLSDWLGVENLFARSFALARWWVREAAFGLGESAPEWPSRGRRRFLIVFAISVWVYRFFLFLGIALVVYHLFFKLLGLILMALEIWWFIMRPITIEFGEWWTRRRNMRLNARTLVTLSAMGVLLGLFFVPWRTGVEAPALMTGRDHITVYSPLSAELVSLQTEVGDRVDQGTVLAVLRSSELEYRLAQARRREGVLEWEIANAGTSGKLSTRRLVADEELRTVRFNLAGLAEEMRRLTLAAPIAGTVTEAPEDLHPGQWISRTAPLFKVVDGRRPIIEGYVPESDLGRLDMGAKATFSPDDPGLAPIPCRLIRIDTVAAKVLSHPSLATVHGGSIATRPRDDGSLAPEGAHYRVILEPESDLSEFPERSIRGLALISGRTQSLAERTWTTVMSVLIRESGF